MDGDSDTAMYKGMAQLRRQYLLNLKARKEELENFVAIGAETRFDKAQRDEIESIAHKMAGTGATYGLPSVSETGRILELCVRKPPSTAAVQLGCENEEVIKAIRDVIETIADVEHSDFESSAPTRPGEAAQSSHTSTQRLPLVLIVDDDPYIREVIMMALRDDARVIMARNSEQALALIADERPDFLHLDHAMPGGLSGIGLLEHMNSLPGDVLAKTKVIMVTGNSKNESIKRATIAGAVDYIHKPFSIEIVREKILKRVKRREKTILIADDDEAMSELLRLGLETAGFNILVTTEGMETLQLLRRESPHLVLLDRAIPGCDGIAILQEIRRNPRHANTPVIMITASRDEETVRMARKFGVTDYCVKPFEPQFIVDRCLRCFQ